MTDLQAVIKTRPQDVLLVNVVRNMPLSDGPPRHEKGYRAFIQRGIIGPMPPHQRYKRSVVEQSPLFVTEEQALLWVAR